MIVVVHLRTLVVSFLLLLLLLVNPSTTTAAALEGRLPLNHNNNNNNNDPQPPPPPPPPCSLNGKLVRRVIHNDDDDDDDKDDNSSTTATVTFECHCDLPWSGPNCSSLTFQPLQQFPQGYGMKPNITTWGGGILYDTENDTNTDNNVYHMFVSTMTNNCTLRSWTTNSRIDHVISNTSIIGPYIFHDVAIPTWSHNPAPIQLSNKMYAIIHIGTGNGLPNGGKNCSTSSVNANDADDDDADDDDADDDSFFSKFKEYQHMGINGNNEEDKDEDDLLPLLAIDQQRLKRNTRFTTTTTTTDDSTSSLLLGGGSTIHISQSLYGPWHPLPSSQNSLGNCGNPSPFVHRNGTIFIVCNNRIFQRAEQITGPWTILTQHITKTDGPHGNYEDGQLYIDEQNHFHILWHVYNTNEHPPHGHECYDSTVSAHSYSIDGIIWYTSPDQPYTTQLVLSSGLTVTVATRERPKLVFDHRSRMTHLINGVCSAPACPNGPPTGCVDCKYDSWDFTLISPFVIDDETE